MKKRLFAILLACSLISSQMFAYASEPDATPVSEEQGSSETQETPVVEENVESGGNTVDSTPVEGNDDTTTDTTTTDTTTDT
ncbi:MAG: hypothetical protein R3Y67_10385, partial [Eubacteriales bacterium]